MEETGADIPTIKLDVPEEESTTDGTKDTPGTVDEAKSNASRKDILGLPISPSRHRSKALLAMDSKHSWLEEADRKSANLETAFISKVQYVALSNHFQEYLEYLQSKKDELPEVHGEFANLFDKFRTCFVGSQRLQNKVFELNAQNAIANSQIRKLKIKLFDVENKVKELSDRIDDMNRSAVQSDQEKLSLRHQVMELKEEQNKAREQQQYTKEEEQKPFSDEKEEERVKIKKMEKQLTSLVEDLESVKKIRDVYHNQLSEADEEIATLRNDLTATKSELQKKFTSLEKADEKIKDMTTQLEKEMESKEELASEIKSLHSEIQEFKTKYTRVSADLKTFQKEVERKSQSMDKLRRDLDVREDRVTLLLSQKEALDTDLSQKIAEINSLKVDNSKISKQKSDYFRKVGLLENKIKDLDLKMGNLKEENVRLKRDLETMAKASRDFDGKIKELTKERDGYLEELKKQTLALSSKKQALKLIQETEVVLKRELDACNRTTEDLQSALKKQKIEHERSLEHGRTLSKTIEDLQDEVKRMELQLAESQKTASSLEQQLGDERLKSKNLAEDVRFYRKSCTDAKHVAEQAEGKLEILNKHVLQLRSYNQNLDEKRTELMAQNQNITEQLGSVREFLKQEKKSGENLAAKLRYKYDEERVHLKKISNLEQEITTFRRKLEASMKEEDGLILKIQEKDCVISNLKEKIQLVESELKKTELILGERVDDVKLLKLQLCQMSRSQALLEGQVENMHAARQELTNLQEELQDEKLKCKGMEEEIQRPVNFHRWRILEGTDPDRAQLVTKTLELQRQLVTKTANLEAKEVELRHKDAEIEKLRQKCRRRSESEVDNELWECKSELKARMVRLKCLTAENNMYESVIGKYKDEIKTLREELKKCKMANFKFKLNI